MLFLKKKVDELENRQPVAAIFRICVTIIIFLKITQKESY